MADDMILYTSPDGETQIDLRVEAGSVWLTQLEIAELFQVTKNNVSIHTKNILQEGELSPKETVKESLTVQTEGKREVQRRITLYNLDLILAIGYRVRSVRGTQFRQWATRHLREFLIKGFVMDDERLKDPSGWDYFDELLARIREIRASEKRFYQKVRDLFALSNDYQKNDHDAQLFFAEVQNKLLYAVSELTAAEIICERADPGEPNMGLSAWKGSRVRKADVIIAKNYLKAEEIDTLNRLVVIFLEQAELRAKQRLELTLAYWRDNVDRLLEFNERPVFDHKGTLSAEEARTLAEERYESFDTQRRQTEVMVADAEDLAELEQIERNLEQKPKPK